VSAVDRLNRTVLLLLGLLLIAVGGYGLARGFGAFGQDPADDATLSDTVVDFAARNTEWFWPAVALGALLLAYLALRWFQAQIPVPQTVRQIDLTKDSTRGTTRARAGGVARALAADVDRQEGVSSAKARFVQRDGRADLEVVAEIFDDADLEDVRRHIEERALARFRRTLEPEDMRVHLIIRPGRGSAGRRLE
jgi:hypothetical protein